MGEDEEEKKVEPKAGALIDSRSEMKAEGSQIIRA